MSDIEFLMDSEKPLEQVAGKKVKAVTGYVSHEFGKDVPVFKLYRVIYEDNSFDFIEGEHDMPYVPESKTLTREKLDANREE